MPAFHRQVRWTVLALLLGVTVINFIDRQVLAVVAPLLRDSFHLTNSDYGTIVASFQFGMLLGELPMGMLMDRVGARMGLTFAVTFWSIGNALHVFARSTLGFSAFRFWLGSGECGNYSGGMKVVSQWFPQRERALAIGIFNGGSMVGSIIAPPLIAFITLAYGWQSAFLISGGLGLVWVLLWRFLYQPPERHPRLTAAEAAYISADGPAVAGPVPTTRQLLRLRATWGVMACRFLVGPVFQFYIYWLPEYLFRQRGFDLRAIGIFAWVPFLLGDLGSMGGGFIAGRLIKSGLSVARTRTLTMLVGAGLCFMSLLVALATTALWAMVGVSLVLFGHCFLSANMFASISDAFPVGAVSRVTGLTGIAGGISGVIFPKLVGYVVDAGSYTPIFSLASLMPLLGVLCLMLSRRQKPDGRLSSGESYVEQRT